MDTELVKTKERAPGYYYKEDKSTLLLRIDRWVDHAPFFIQSLELTTAEHCNDVRAIDSTVKEEEEQHLLFILEKPEYSGRVLITYILIKNTDKISLSFERIRCYRQ